MSHQQTTPVPYVQPYRYPSPNLPMAAIRRFARRIAERFHPQKIILFGSYAYGTPHAESDVDLLVIMPASDVVNQAIRINLAFEHPFLSASGRPNAQADRGAECVTTTGSCGKSSRRETALLQSAKRRNGWRKAEDDWEAAGQLAARKLPLRYPACFHCQ